jgi:hypothetical protein
MGDGARVEGRGAPGPAEAPRPQADGAWIPRAPDAEREAAALQIGRTLKVWRQAAGGAEIQAPKARALGNLTDTFVDTTPQIQQYVRKVAEGGLRVEGHVHIYAPEEFERRFVAYATGAGWTNEKANDEKTNVNGYQDGTEIHIRRNTGVDTVIHEAVHLHASGAFATAVGRAFNEGATEHFTILICERHGLKRDPKFGGDRLAAGRVAARLGVDVLAAAYFRGAVPALEAAFDAAAGGAGKFKKWLKHLDEKQHQLAIGIL